MQLSFYILSQLLLFLLPLVAGNKNGGSIQDFSTGKDELAAKVVEGKAMMRGEREAEGKCTLQMFSNNSAAYWACRWGRIS